MDERLKDLVANPAKIAAIRPQDDALCLELVRQCPEAFQYVPNKTAELCVAAVAAEPKLIEKVPKDKLTSGIAWLAIDCSFGGDQLRFIPKALRTPALCKRAAETMPSSLEYMSPDEQTEEACIAALSHRLSSDDLLTVVHRQTDAICLAAVTRWGNAIRFVDNKTEAICWAALRNGGAVLQYIDHPSEAMCLEALRQCASQLADIPAPTPEMLRVAMETNGYCLYLIEQQTPELIKIAMNSNHQALRHVDLDLVADRLMEPGSGQLSYWLDIFRHAQISDQSQGQQKLTQLMKRLRLGKAHTDDWLRPAGRGEVTMLDLLLEFAGHMRHIRPHHQATQRWLARVDKQVEWALNARHAAAGPRVNSVERESAAL